MQHRRGDRSRFQNSCAAADRRDHGHRWAFLRYAAREASDVGGALCGADHVSFPRICCSWWANKLWDRCPRHLSPDRNLRGRDPQGGEAGRVAGPAANQIRVGHQSENRKSAGLKSAAHAASRCRRGNRVTRREFIALFGAAAAWPLAARAQQPAKLPTIWFLGGTTPETWSRFVAAFVHRLRELGWIEGRTIAIEYRWAEGRGERFAEIAAEFVRLKVDVIVTVGGAVLAAKQATSVIPIVFAVAADPVSSGLVGSLARPGGNVTGLSLQQTDAAGKRLELLREVLPDFRRLAIMANVGYPAAVLDMNEVQVAARKLGLEVVDKLEIRKAEDVAPAFDALDGFNALTL